MKFLPQRLGWRKLICLLTAVSFLGSIGVISPSRSYALSISEEKEIGRKLLEVIREKMTLVEDGEILTYVQSVGNRIVRQVGTTTYTYQFFVVDAPVPNAFAVPGGYIFLYRGIIDLMASEGELAGILSHELAHIQARHIHRAMDKSRLTSIASMAGLLAGILLGTMGGGSGAQALAMGSMAGATSMQLKYSRDHEGEADQLGFRYLCAAGYPPQDMASTMHKLNQGTYFASSRIPSYLSTHPGLTERIQILQAMATKEMGQREKNKKSYDRSPTEGDFQFMQAALTAQYSDAPDLVERLQAKVKEGHTPSIYGLGRLYLKQGKIDDAVVLLQQAARQSAGSTFVLSTLGSAYAQQGKFEDARKVLQTALLLDPSASIVHLRLARVLQEMGQRDEALTHLRLIEGIFDAFPEIDYQMGVLLGQNQRLGEAHFHLGRYSESKMDWNGALFHYKKAKSLLPLSAIQVEELDALLKNIEKTKKESAIAHQRR